MQHKQAQPNDTSNHAIKNLCEQGQLKDAVHALQLTSTPLELSTYAYLLQSCTKKNALPEGKLIHAHIIERACVIDTFLHNALVMMYVKCGNLADSREVFDRIPERDDFSWNVMIAAYTKHRIAVEALRLFYQMQRTGIEPNPFTFVSILPACTSSTALDQGIEIHEKIIRSGFQSDVFVVNGARRIGAPVKGVGIKP